MKEGEVMDWVDVRKGDLVHIHTYNWNGPRGRDDYDVWGIALYDTKVAQSIDNEPYVGFSFRRIAGDVLGNYGGDENFVAVSTEDTWDVPFTADVPEDILATWSKYVLLGGNNGDD